MKRFTLANRRRYVKPNANQGRTPQDYQRAGGLGLSAFILGCDVLVPSVQTGSTMPCSTSP